LKGGKDLAKYNTVLYDDIGNEYKRKNLYLKELSNLQEQYDDTKDTDTLKKINTLKASKASHFYIVKLEDFKIKETNFKKELKIKVSEYGATLPDEMSVKMKRIKKQEKASQLRKEFYSSYQSFSYDTYFEYEKSVIEVRQFPSIIEHLDINEKGLAKSLNEKKHLDLDLEVEAKKELNIFKKEQKEKLIKGIEGLKVKRNERQISKKALEDGIKGLELQCSESVNVQSFSLPVKSNKEKIANYRFEINKTSRRKENVLKSNVADLRRKTPTEYEKTVPLHALYGSVLPGVGQLLNKQYAKAIFFFALALFVYGIAIPYALGFGNYQGKGIAGLISLAAEGEKIDKSLIFMIEGIIAIFLLCFAVIIYIFNFRDALEVEKAEMRGVRPKVWFETWTSVSEEGFPYMVSLPALVVTVFIVIVPISTAIMLSFTNMDPKNQSKFEWIGIDNYKLIALGEGIAGKAFWLILGWTLVWTIVATTLAIFIGFVLAMMVNYDRIKFKGFFRAIYLLPWAVPGFITIMFFSIMVSRNGAITDILSMLFNARIEIKNDPNLTRLALIMLQGWLGSSYVFLLSTGVLQAIPGDLYEAAQIDGATTWQKIKKITLPIVLFQTAPLLVGQYTFNFNNFSIVYLFNGGGPFNPTEYGNLAGTTDLLISYVYKLTMQNDYQAIGAAITIVISLGLMLFAFIGFKNSKAFKEEKL